MKKTTSFLKSITSSIEEAAVLQLKTDLIMVVNQHLKEKGWSQKEIGELLGIPQSRVSNLVNDRIDLFSVGMLISFLSRLGFRMAPDFDVEIGPTCSIEKFEY